MGVVKGVDYSPVSVEKAKKVNEDAILNGRCVILQGNVADLIFAAEQFDLVTAFETVYFWPDLLQSFREVHRVLKPGGMFLICNECGGDNEKDEKWTEKIDGMGLKDHPNIKSKCGKDVNCFFFTGLFYAVMGHPGPRRKKFLARISGRTLEEAERILYGRATWKSWRDQDYYLIGKKTDYSLFTKTDMHLWYGIKGSVDKKLSKNLGALKASGYSFAVKIFTDLGHGGLAGEHPEQFVREVSATHEKSLAGKSEEK